MLFVLKARSGCFKDKGSRERMNYAYRVFALFCGIRDFFVWVLS